MNKIMCGIYKIENLVNGKVYIGQAKNIEKRWIQHKNMHKRDNQVIYSAMRKYGIENFSFEILILCEEELLDLMEIYYIEQYNSYIHAENSNGYNMTTGGSGIKGHLFSKETKRKMSEKAKGKYKGKNNPMYNKQHSDETKKKMKEKAFGRKWSKKSKEKASKSHMGYKHSEDVKVKIGKAHKGKILSEETKRKLSESRKGKFCDEHAPRSKKTLCGNIIFPNVRKCSYYYGVSESTMNGYLNGNDKMPKKWEKLGLRYATKEDMKIYPMYNEKIHGEKTAMNINVKKKIKVYCENIIFETIKSCAEYYGIPKTTMSNWLNGKNPMPQKFKDLGLRYATEQDLKEMPS